MLGWRMTNMAQQLFNTWVQHAGRSRQTLEIAEQHVLRALRDLCSEDVEPHPAGFGDAEGLPNLLLVGAKPLGILDAGVSGDGEEPVITMELLPVCDVPFGARIVESWSAGAQGHRYRERVWTFEWEGPPHHTREIKYCLDVRDADLRAEPALLLARRAGWPLPSTVIAPD